jgi:5-hydroxyisourate hydrolase
MSERSPITTHVLDTAHGRPAAGVGVTLSCFAAGAADWQAIATGTTDSDGRASQLMRPGTLSKGLYRLQFATGAYFSAHGIESIFPEVSIEFRVTDAAQHYHIPLLLSPFAYSTYRGS